MRRVSSPRRFGIAQERVLSRVQANDAREVFLSAAADAVAASDVAAAQEAAQEALRELEASVALRELSQAAARDAVVRALRNIFRAPVATRKAKKVAGLLKNFADLKREQLGKLINEEGVSQAWKNAFNHAESWALDKLAARERAVELMRERYIQPFILGPQPFHPVGLMLGLGL